MAAAAETHDSQLEEVFPVPGWESVAAVRLRVVGFEALDKIVMRHQRVRNQAMQKLYTAADQLLIATTGFYEVVDGTIPAPSEDPVEGMTWSTLARAGIKTLGMEATPRQAMIRLVGDERLPFFWNDWLEWVKSERNDPEDDILKDFPTTR